MKIVKITVAVIIGLIISSVIFYAFWLSPRYTVPILTYHDFGNGKGITVTPEHFDRQMRYLKEKHYSVISLDALVEAIKERKKFPHNTVVITMDDGYRDNFVYAYPILKKYRFPAEIFLIANNIGTDANFLNWDQIRDMARNHISFGGHTKNHVYLPEIKNKEILWDEIYGCKKIIEEHIGKPTYYFSYPKGGFTEEIKTLVKKAGYKAACTTNRGFDKLNRSDAYGLNRVSVRDRDNPFSLWVKLSGYYNLFRKARGGE